MNPGRANVRVFCRRLVTIVGERYSDFMPQSAVPVRERFEGRFCVRFTGRETEARETNKSRLIALTGAVRPASTARRLARGPRPDYHEKSISGHP
jgi:hypothetical protein